MISCKKILIATGGTGGHVFPAYSLAKYFQEKDIHVEITTDKRGLRFLKNYPELNIKVSSSATIFGKSFIKSILSFFTIFFSFVGASFILLKNRPDFVFGMGGYSSFPTCIAAAILRVPFVIYENNLLIGKTNKYLLPFAKKIFISYPEISGIKNKYKSKIFYSGNIIRKEILEYKHSNNYQSNKDLKILVLGGSQAAKIFGEKLPNIFNKCKDSNITIEIFQQCLLEQKWHLETIYKQGKIKYELFNFNNNILDYFKKIDLVITRSGASMMSELLNSKIPFISIPLPSSSDNHQYLNAKYFMNKGYCFLVEERNINENLFSLINSIYKDKSLLDQIIQKQNEHSDKNVFNKIELELEKLINEKN